MRPPTITKNVGGRFVFAALTVILSWQMHISVSGMKVPLLPIVIAFSFLSAVVLFFKNKWVVLGAAVIAQALVHFGSDFTMNLMMGHHHMSNSISAAMFAAHTVAASVGWVALTQGENLISLARELFVRFFMPRIPVAAPIPDASPRLFDSTFSFIDCFDYTEISRRGPPIVA